MRPTIRRRPSSTPSRSISPEWQALRFALERRRPVRFIDLPAANQLAKPDEPETPERRSRPTMKRAIAAGARSARHARGRRRRERRRDLVERAGRAGLAQPRCLSGDCAGDERRARGVRGRSGLPSRSGRGSSGARRICACASARRCARRTARSRSSAAPGMCRRSLGRAGRGGSRDAEGTCPRQDLGDVGALDRHAAGGRPRATAPA